MSTAVAILEREPDWQTLPGGTPLAIRDLFRRSLQKDATRRLQDIGDARIGIQEARSAGRTRSHHLSDRPEVRPCRTTDGVPIAYADNGSGPVLIRVLGWFTHVEMEWQWPALRLIWERLGETQTVVRYDGRGIGLSGPWPGPFSKETRHRDLQAVLDAVGVEQVVLYGVSEGGWTAACYTRDHPERVSQLILYGAYSRGTSLRAGFDPEEDRALLTLMRKGWRIRASWDISIICSGHPPTPRRQLAIRSRLTSAVTSAICWLICARRRSSSTARMTRR